jgi:hypothetical protein
VAEEDAEDLAAGGPGEDQRPGRVEETEVAHQDEGGDQRQHPGHHQQRQDRHVDDLLAGEPVPSEDVTAERGEEDDADDRGNRIEKTVEDVPAHRLPARRVVLPSYGTGQAPEAAVDLPVVLEREEEHQHDRDETEHEQRQQDGENRPLTNPTPPPPA